METNNLNERYKEISKRSGEFFRFTTLYSEYLKKPRDYGTGEKFNTLEIHILTEITDNPGITASNLTISFRKTKGFISKVLSRLEDLDLIYKEKHPESSKYLKIYATEKGINYTIAHKAYDDIGYLKLSTAIIEKSSRDDLDNFYKVLDIVCNIFENELK